MIHSDCLKRCGIKANYSIDPNQSCDDHDCAMCHGVVYREKEKSGLISVIDLVGYHWAIQN